MKDFILFRKLITPMLIQAIFWIALVLLIYITIKDLSLHQYLSALQIIIIGPLVLRVVCESLILMFRVNANLTEINKKIA